MDTATAQPLPLVQFVSIPVAPEPVRDSLGLIDVLLRDRPRFLTLLDDDAARAQIAKTMLVTIALGAAVFGVATGSYRGGLQILAAGVKFPLIELIMAAICAPALGALNAAVHGKTDLRRDFVLILSSFALTSLVMAALAPVMLLARCYSMGYHRTAIIMFGACAVAGVAGVSLLLKGLTGGTEKDRRIVGVVLAAVAIIAGSQVAWFFRPYIGRPANEVVPLIRARESNLADELGKTVNSARDKYDDFDNIEYGGQ
jgi:hypothetical protein